MSTENKPTSWLKVITGSTVGVIIAVVVMICCCCFCCFVLYAISSSVTPTPSGVRIDTSESDSRDANSDNKANKTSPEESTGTQFYIGDTVLVKDLSITVNSLQDYTSDNQYLQPDSGNKYIALEITIENINAASQGYANPFNFSLQDADGYIYDYSWSGKEPMLTSDEIQRGRKQKGFLTFEVPAAQTEFVLDYDSSFWGGNDTVTINLTTR